MLPDHETFAPGVDQLAAFPAYGLADERQLAAGARTKIEHRGMELDELDIPQPSPSAKRSRDAISGGDRRIRRHSVDLTNATRGKDDCARVHRTDASASALPKNVQRHSGDCRPLIRTDLGWNQVEDQRLLDDLDTAIGGDRGDERTFDLRAGGVTSGMRDPVPVVAALTSQFQLAGPVAIKLCASVDELRHLVGAFSDQDAYRLFDTKAGACDQGVVDVLLGGVSLSLHPGDPTLRPMRRASGDLILGDDHDRAQIPALQSSRQTCDTRSDYHNVDLAYPPRRFCGESPRQRGQWRQCGEGR